MTDIQHTPGPWHYLEAWSDRKNEHLCFHTLHAENGKILASTWAGPHIANARLIAAAPELLEALKFYADRENHIQHTRPLRIGNGAITQSNYEIDEGDKARKAITRVCGEKD